MVEVAMEADQVAEFRTFVIFANQHHRETIFFDVYCDGFVRNAFVSHQRILSCRYYFRSDFAYSLFNKSIISSRRSYKRFNLRGSSLAKAYAVISGKATVEST